MLLFGMPTKNNPLGSISILIPIRGKQRLPFPRIFLSSGLEWSLPEE